MKQKSNYMSNKLRLGWILLAVSLIAISGGLAVRFFKPAVIDRANMHQA